MRISDWSSDVCSSDLNSLAEVTAIDLLNSIVQRMLDQVASGQSNNSNQADSENLRQFNEQLARVRQRLFERESTVNQRSEEHTSELQSLMRISYAVFCLKKKNETRNDNVPEN